jgi:hypothetical protein
VLASGGEDNLVAVWSLDRAHQAAGGSSTRGNAASRAGPSNVAGREAPPELLFKHVGHKGGVS